MAFMAWIRQKIVDIAQQFLNLYYETNGWAWPLSAIHAWFLMLYFRFIDLARDWLDFEDWVNDVTDKVTDILDSWDIISLLNWWLTAAENAWSWVSNAVNNVRNIVDSWWEATLVTVQGWIAVATQGFNDLVVAWGNFWNTTWPEWTGELATLKADWDEFWTVTYPTLVSFTWLGTWWNARLTDIGNLIDSAFVVRESLWSGWQELRDQVVEFFSSPLDFLLDKFTDWFLGPEE